MKYIRIPKHLIISTVLILLCLAAFCFPAYGEDSADEIGRASCRERV